MADASALLKLLDKLTAPKQLSLDPIAKQHVLSMCRESEESLLETYHYLFDRLKASNSHSRLLALELCNDLFMRAKVAPAHAASRTEFTHCGSLHEAFAHSGTLTPFRQHCGLPKQCYLP
jgi:hypothetical protein